MNNLITRRQSRKERSWILTGRFKPSNPPIEGLTLSELLVAILLSSVIAILAGSIVLDNIKVTSRQDSILRLQEDWNRIQFLIDQDLAEGSGACMEGSTLTIYDIKKVEKDGSSTEVTRSIVYSLVSEGLQRSGPLITSSGFLDPSQSSTDIVASNVNIFQGTTDNETCSESNPSQRISYNLGLQEIRNGKVLARYTNQDSASSGYSRVDPIN